MTCIVGTELPGGVVYIGGDSGVTSDDDAASFVCTTPKVWRPADRAVAGFCGDWEAGNLLQAPSWWPKVTKSPRYVPDVLLPAAVKRCKGLDWHMLVGIRGELWCLDGSKKHGSAFRPAVGWMAIGCGYTYALGAMHHGADVLGALEAAANFMPWVRPPFTILTA